MSPPTMNPRLTAVTGGPAEPAGAGMRCALWFRGGEALCKRRNWGRVGIAECPVEAHSGAKFAIDVMA
jgi:hypothetical protein